MAEKLKSIPNFARMSDRVLRVLGQNPGSFTLQGTNTYLISPLQHPTADKDGLPTVLIDTGEGEEEYAPLLESVLLGKEEGSNVRRYITDIILTHHHFDHVGGLSQVLRVLKKTRENNNIATPLPRIHKLPGKYDDEIVKEQLSGESEGLFAYAEASNSQPIGILSPDSKVPLSPLLKNALTFRVVHTPGHTADHICLFLEEEKRMFTADHVLGHGTSVFENLGEYMRSLKLCSQVLDEQTKSDEEVMLYPAHGHVVEEGKALLKQYYIHRQKREDQVLEFLTKDVPADAEGTDRNKSAGSDPKAWTVWQLTSQLYASYPQSVWPAAARGLFQHLQKLATPDPEQANASSGNGGERVKCLDTQDGIAPPMPEMGSKDLGKYVRDYRWKLIETNRQTAQL